MFCVRHFASNIPLQVTYLATLLVYAHSLLSFAEQPSAESISTAGLSLLLEGATFTVHKRARTCCIDA